MVEITNEMNLEHIKNVQKVLKIEKEIRDNIRFLLVLQAITLIIVLAVNW